MGSNGIRQKNQRKPDLPVRLSWAAFVVLIKPQVYVL